MGGVPYLSVVIIPGDESLLVTVDNSPPFKQFQGCFFQAANISPFVRLTFRDVWRETPPSRRTVTPPWDDLPQSIAAFL